MFDGEGLLQITYLTDWVKRFQKFGDKHRLVSITDNNKNNLSLNYHENQLSEIVGANGRKVTIKRDDQRHISAITDNNNRIVQYHYNQKGLLEAVIDLGGNQTKYQYHGNGLLHKATDPEGQLAAQFSFGKNNKATSVKIRARKFRYSYKGNKTQVTDESGQTTTFEQNTKGVTTSVTTDAGFASRIVLNERNQVAELWHKEPGQSGALQAKIVYDDNGRPARYDINGKPTQMERDLQQHCYQYDDAGRLLAVGDRSFTYDARGNLTQHKTDKFVRTYQYASNGDVVSESTSLMGLAATTVDYGYNNDGQLTQIKANAQISKFEYNPIGKLSKVTFPDGASHAYQYDKLGFRKHTKRSDTSAVDYLYDKVGNLKETKKYQVGATIGHSNKITLNDNNQVMAVTGVGQTPMTIKYTAKGNPQSISKGENTTEYQYDSHERLIGINDSQTGQVNYAYQKGEEGIRLQLDDRTKGERSNRAQVTAHNQTQAQLQYARMTGSPWQSVIWHESLNKILVPLPGEINAPDIGFQSTKQRRRLRDAKSIIKGQQLEHDKPSNSQFTPSEYSLVNCDIVGDDGEPGGTTQDCYLHGVILDDASTITVGIPYTFSAFAVAGSKCEPTYSFAVDGVNVGLSDSGYFTHSFGTPGEHSVQTTAHCRRCVGYYKWDGIEVNVQCPLPVSQTSTRLTTINYIKTVTAPDASMSDEIWGQMGFANGAALLTIDITPYYEPNSDSWKARITQASSNYWMWWRLLPPRPTINKPNAVLEATASQATKENCTKMMADLKSLGAHDVDWYVLDAVEEHEKAHEKEWKVMLDAAYLVIASKIEVLSVPHVCGMTAAQAKAKFKALGEYVKVLEDEKFKVATAFIRKKDPNAQTNAAEFSKTVPVIASIVNKAAADWPQACKQ